MSLELCPGYHEHEESSPGLCVQDAMNMRSLLLCPGYHEHEESLAVSRVP